MQGSEVEVTAAVLALLFVVYGIVLVAMGAFSSSDGDSDMTDAEYGAGRARF